MTTAPALLDLDVQEEGGKIRIYISLNILEARSQDLIAIDC